MPNGVAFNAPPPHLIPDLQHSIATALQTLPPDKRGALVGIVTETGVNAAIVARVNDVWAVQAWVGKSWGEKHVEAGAQIRASW